MIQPIVDGVGENDQAKIDAILLAIEQGATPFAGPETARELNSSDLPFVVQVNRYLREGVVYAVDMRFPSSLSFGSS